MHQAALASENLIIKPPLSSAYRYPYQHSQTSLYSQEPRLSSTKYKTKKISTIPNWGDIIRIPAYSAKYEEATQYIEWSQNFFTRSETYYIVDAKNVTQGNSDVLLYVQKSWFKEDSNVAEHVSKIAQKASEDGSHEVTLDYRFQYGQKNKEGESRFVVYHDKNNKPYQHRFIISTIQGNAANWAKNLLHNTGAGEFADTVYKLGNNFIGDYLHTY